MVMYDEEPTLDFAQRMKLLECTPSGRLAATRLRALAAEAEQQGTATFAATPSLSPDPFRIGEADGAGYALSWIGAGRRPPEQSMQETAHSCWIHRTPPLMRPEGRVAYERFVRGFASGFDEVWHEQPPGGAQGPLTPAIRGILNYERRRKLLYATDAGRATIEREFDRKRQAAPYAGTDAPHNYAAAQGQVKFSATGVLSDAHQDGVHDGITAALELHRGGAQYPTGQRMHSLALERWHARMKGVMRTIDPSEPKNYEEGFRVGCQLAWRNQAGAGAGQGVKAALAEEARKSLLMQSEEGRRQLAREERARG
jgi:hypothetical protein